MWSGFLVSYVRILLGGSVKNFSNAKLFRGQIKFRNTSNCYGYSDKSTHYILCVGVFSVKSAIRND
jgi:hypothetical protein